MKRVSISVDSSTEVGSSRMITGGFEVRCSMRSTLAISTICRSAKLSVSVRASGSMCGADLVELLLGELAHGVPAVDAAAYARALAAEHDVLGGGEVGHQRLLLEHHADAVVGGVDDAAEPDLLAAHPDLAGVGPDQADQRLEQGGLAGTVLAGEAEHLVLADDQVDTVERLDARVVLDQAAHLEGVDRGRRRRLGLGLQVGGHLVTWFLRRWGKTAAATAATTMRPWTPPCQ